MKKATVHIFSPLHMSIILEMSMAKPALHKDEPTPSPMRKSVSLKKNKQKPKRNKQRGLKALVPHCVGIRHIPSWLFFFLFPVSQQTKFLCLFMLKLFHSWLKFTFGHRSYSACWIQDENPLNPQVLVQLPPHPQPLIKMKITKKENQEIGKKAKNKKESEDWIRTSCITGWTDSCINISVPCSYTEDKW